MKRLHLVPFAAVEYAVDSVHCKGSAHKGAAEQCGIAGQVELEPCSKQPCRIKICTEAILRLEVGVGNHHHRGRGVKKFAEVVDVGGPKCSAKV